MSFNTHFQDISQTFVTHFYDIFQKDRSQLHLMYHPEHAFLTFEGSQHQGREAIHAKYTSLPFQNIGMIITKVDPQPTADAGILIMVIGQIKADQDAPMGFTQLFHLKNTPDGNWVVVNDVFRLNLHNL